MSFKIFNEIKSLICRHTHHPQQNVQDQIDNLKIALRTKTGVVFETALKKAKETIRKEKEHLLEQLREMNGDYYQDPKSTLKMKWDVLVLAVHSAHENARVEKRDQLEETSAHLSTLSTKIDTIAGTKIIAAQMAIENYQEEERKRDDCQKRLNAIICIEKVSENFKHRLITYKNFLQKEYEKLCGQFFGDPQGELDQAWKAYQKAEMENSAIKNDLLKDYQQLDEMRKKIEAQLYFVDHYLALGVENPSSYEDVATQWIKDQIEDLSNRATLQNHNEFELADF